MKKKLRIAILWHQHQPYYRKEDEFVLPWVRLHGVKDYYDLAALHWEFPELKLSYNVVPSLLMQLDEYREGLADSVLRLSRLHAAELLEQEKRDILATFFLCNHERMLHPYTRYRELYEQSRDTEYAIQNFREGDWRDLQVWYNLTWIGALSRRAPGLQRLFDKGRDFSKVEKNIVLSHHTMLLGNIVPVMQQLHEAGMAELSVTPLYHPIMPLVIDSHSALEATPEVILPLQRYTRQDDADYQLQRGVQIFEEHFNTGVTGMWCSEGSISEPTLRLLATRGIRWTASDEAVLQHTKADEYSPLDKYFAHRVNTKYNNSIVVFFRDHELSDAIGFVYQKWKAEDAASDFIARLHAIRENLVQRYGEEVLDEAVVPVILDGENCWEYYENNGIDFLRSLYSRLVNDEELTTVSFRDVTTTVEEQGKDYAHQLEGITAGSWIFGNFKIWIGQEEKNTAWDILWKARKLIDSRRVSHSIWKEAMEHVYIAEGSDWFWWYGDDHSAASRHVFDELFRYHIRCIYELYEEPVPKTVRQPIMKHTAVDSHMSAMHRVSS